MATDLSPVPTVQLADQILACRSDDGLCDLCRDDVSELARRVEAAESQITILNEMVRANATFQEGDKK